jgi:adenylate cyclase class 2
MLRRNLELKARCGDLAYAREAALHLGADPSAFERQRDTFYNSRDGRLKLREITRWPGLHSTDDPGTRAAELIWYDRPDHVDARTSAYRLVPAPDPAGLHAALTAACGVRGVVAKDRTILLWQGVRIHLDTIEGLGTFVEFEAVLGPDLEPEAAADHLGTLRHALRIREHDRVATAYADLLGL